MPNINFPFKSGIYSWFLLVLVEVNWLIFHFFKFGVFCRLYIARWRNDLYNFFVATFPLSRMHVNNLRNLVLKKSYNIKTPEKTTFCLVLNGLKMWRDREKLMVFCKLGQPYPQYLHHIFADIFLVLTCVIDDNCKKKWSIFFSA